MRLPQGRRCCGSFRCRRLYHRRYGYSNQIRRGVNFVDPDPALPVSRSARAEAGGMASRKVTCAARKVIGFEAVRRQVVNVAAQAGRANDLWR